MPGGLGKHQVANSCLLSAPPPQRQSSLPEPWNAALTASSGAREGSGREDGLQENY